MKVKNPSVDEHVDIAARLTIFFPDSAVSTDSGCPEAVYEPFSRSEFDDCNILNRSSVRSGVSNPYEIGHQFHPAFKAR